jgi:hypothetical protein
MHLRYATQKSNQTNGKGIMMMNNDDDDNERRKIKRTKEKERKRKKEKKDVPGSVGSPATAGRMAQMGAAWDGAAGAGGGGAKRHRRLNTAQYHFGQATADHTTQASAHRTQRTCT